MLLLNMIKHDCGKTMKYLHLIYVLGIVTGCGTPTMIQQPDNAILAEAPPLTILQNGYIHAPYSENSNPVILQPTPPNPYGAAPIASVAPYRPAPFLSANTATYRSPISSYSSTSSRIYTGNCPTPDSYDAAGRRCGARSAASRVGGYSSYGTWANSYKSSGGSTYVSGHYRGGKYVRPHYRSSRRC